MSSDGLAVEQTRPVPVPMSDMAATSSLSPSSPPPPSKCPWANIKAQTPKDDVSLSEIMSEQLASKIQADEEQKFVNEILEEPLDIDVASLDLLATRSEDCTNDQMIAQMLQLQFNKEYDEEIKRNERKFNGDSKVSISFSNYMVTPTDDTDSDEELENFFPPKSWDSFEAHEKAFPEMGKSGYVRLNNEVITKHDVTMAGRRNACRVMEFPPCISTGDGASFDMQLSNKVYNTLKVYSRAEESRRTRMHDKVERSTHEMAMDAKTRLILYKLVNNSILDKVHGVISTGKEAVVLYATGGSLGNQTELLTEIPAECVVKVFKTTLNEFKTRDKYIREDFRFKERYSKQNPRKIIHLWAEKEMHNLNRMNKVGIPCPHVVLLKKHLLVMSLIGKDGQGAPMLKEVKFNTQDEDDMKLLQSAYRQTLDTMHKLYKECNLIHADLSEFNILWHENKCYFIDVSQSVEPTHPHGLEFLYRDCVNICTYFGKKGISDVQTPEALFTDICGFRIDGSGAEIINQIRDYEKNVELLTFAQPEKSYPFEYCWERTKKSEHEEEDQASSSSNL